MSYDAQLKVARPDVRLRQAVGLSILARQACRFQVARGVPKCPRQVAVLPCPGIKPVGLVL